MKHVVSHVATFATGLVVAAFALSLHTPSAKPSAIDDRGAVPVSGVVTVEEPSIGQYRLRFEGLTKQTEREKPHGIRVVLDGAAEKMRGVPGGEMQFGGVTGLMAVDAEEAPDGP